MPKMPQGGGSAILSFVKLAGVSVGLGYLGYNSMYNVEGGHRAITYSRISGVGEQVMNEGTHFLIPWFERAMIFDIRTRPRSIASLTGSRDLQMVNITLRVLTKPSPKHLPWIYRRLGYDYDERILPSIVNEVLKQVVAQFNASELITQRENVSNLIKRNLVARAADFHIIMEDVAITHLTFGNEYTQAVEAKQVAQQDAERAKFIVDKATQDAKSVVIRAQGEAQAATMIGNALKENPGYVKLRKIEAAQKISNLISRSQNKAYLNTEGLMLNLAEDLNEDAK